MADLVRKLIIDYSDIDRAVRESERLNLQVTDSERRQAQNSQRISRQSNNQRVDNNRRANRRIIQERQKTNERIIQDSKQADKRSGGLLSGSLLLKLGAVAGVGLAGQRLLRFSGNALQARASLESLNKQTAIVLGQDGLQQLSRDYENLGRRLGLSFVQFQELVVENTDLLVPYITRLGRTRQEAVELASSLTGLGGALAYTDKQGRSTVDISRILAKSFLGERDALVSLLIKISEADIQRELQIRGLDKLKGAELDYQKVLITRDLLFESSRDTIELFEKSQDSLQSTLNINQADLANLNNNLKQSFAELAESLVPVQAFFIEFITFAVDGLASVARGIRGIAQEAQASGASGGGLLGNDFSEQYARGEQTSLSDEGATAIGLATSGEEGLVSDIDRQSESLLTAVQTRADAEVSIEEQKNKKIIASNKTTTKVLTDEERQKQAAAERRIRAVGDAAFSLSKNLTQLAVDSAEGEKDAGKKFAASAVKDAGRLAVGQLVAQGTTYLGNPNTIPLGILNFALAGTIGALVDPIANAIYSDRDGRGSVGGGASAPAPPDVSGTSGTTDFDVDPTVSRQVLVDRGGEGSAGGNVFNFNGTFMAPEDYVRNELVPQFESIQQERSQL